MKTKILLIASLLFASFVGKSQVNNFIVSEKKYVIWQNVYETKLSHEEIFNWAVSTGKFTDVNDNGGVITCTIKRMPIDWKASGYRRSQIPIAALLYEFTGFATIQVKDGRYRVTVTDMYLINIDNPSARLGRKSPFEDLALVGHGAGWFTENFEGIASEVFNIFLTNLFDAKTKDYLNNEW